MFDSIPGLDRKPGEHENIKHASLYSQKARYNWLVMKIREMKLTHSKLVAEAEERISSENISWSKMIFTDLFGPDIQVLGEITERLNRIESNITSYQKEARELLRKISLH